MKVKYTADCPARREIELVTRGGQHYRFPYAKMDPAPTVDNAIDKIYVDRELAFDGVTYFLASGEEGAVLLDHVFFLRDECKRARQKRPYRASVKKRARHRYVG